MMIHIFLLCWIIVDNCKSRIFFAEERPDPQMDPMIAKLYKG